MFDIVSSNNNRKTGKKVKDLKQALLTILLMLPMVVFAHGEEILVTVFIELLLIIIFGIILWAIKLNAKGKLIIGVVFILSTAVTLSAIDKLPYNQYMTMINIVIIVVPCTTVSLSFLGLKNRFKKE
jgi:hypothetical protein